MCGGTPWRGRDGHGRIAPADRCSGRTDGGPDARGSVPRRHAGRGRLRRAAPTPPAASAALPGAAGRAGRDQRAGRAQLRGGHATGSRTGSCTWTCADTVRAARSSRAPCRPGSCAPSASTPRGSRRTSASGPRRTGRGMLVLLDNASAAEQVRPLLPGSPSCVVLVTSRDSLAGLVARDGARRLDLDLLPSVDALALLRRLTDDRVDRGSERTSPPDRRAARSARPVCATAGPSPFRSTGRRARCCSRRP